MKKFIIAAVGASLAFSALYAQTETDPGATGVVSAQQRLKEIKI